MKQNKIILKKYLSVNNGMITNYFIYTFIIFLCCFSINIQAQSIQHQVLDVAGTNLTAAGYSMSLSIGQTAISTLKANNYIITQGFQQPEFSKITTTHNPEKTNFQATIFPNPTQDILNINVIGIENASYKTFIFNTMGQLIKKSEFVGNEVSVEVNDLPVGDYILRLQNIDSEQFMVAKFIKY